ncbi:MAG: SUMF1/EgtB/PvdO family nonheme iron enzyme [Myxococcota bacterium]|nr:SUMF1/EgtB/PvdO family nonheme iron enzyme [Myxococcota bacterium]
MSWWKFFKKRTQGADVDRLRGWSVGERSEPLSGGDFRGVRLWSAELQGADLSAANLTHAQLRRVRLVDAQLRGAQLNHADLGAANLERASLCGAELVGVDLGGACLRDADLRGVLTQANVPPELMSVGPETPAADLSGADLRGADLSGADLRGADLTSATLSWANLREANLTGCSLRGAELSWARLCGADLSGADLSRAVLKGIQISSETQWPQGFPLFGIHRFQGPREPGRIRRIEVPGFGGLELVVVPPGTFSMGASDADREAFDDERPAHTVRLTREIMVGQTPVTQGLYRAIMALEPSSNPASDQHPVENVSWFDAIQFCNALSRRCGLESVYSIDGARAVACRFGAHGFRLPTEAEWEYAAKVGPSHSHSSASALDMVAWHAGNSGGRTRPVGQRRPSARGFYDLSGNVYEWVWDWHGAWTGGRISNGEADPSGPQSGTMRVLRGGAFGSDAGTLRVTFRLMRDPKSRFDSSGLRVVLPVREPV